MDWSKSNWEIYARQLILDHYEQPLNRLDPSQTSVDLQTFLQNTNKSNGCIDHLTVYVKISDGKIKQAYFSGIGCAISVAALDLLCAQIHNQTVPHALNTLAVYLQLVHGDKNQKQEVLGDLLVFQNISNQPNRIKCAKVGAQALCTILENYDQEKRN